MAEVLSQSQIDALLGALKESSSDEGGKKVEAQTREKTYRKYDFYSPKKFTKEKLKILKGVYENYSRITSSQINSLFRVNSELTVLSVEEQRYYEFSNALSDNDIFTLVNCQTPDGSKNPPILMHISQIIAVNMIDRMLGGTESDTAIDASYQYTQIEKLLYRRIMEYLIMPIKDVWSGYMRLEAKFDRIEENLGLFQDIGVDEIVVIVMIAVDMVEVSGNISICIPGRLLANIYDVIEKKRHVDTAYDIVEQNHKDEIMDNIEQTMLEVKAEISGVKLTLDDIYNLHVGDVIDLNCPKDSDVSVLVGSKKWFTGQVGVYNKNVAVKIQSKLNELNNGMDLKLVQEELSNAQEST